MTRPDPDLPDGVAIASDDVWRPHVTVATIVPRDGRFLLVEESVRGRLVLNQPAGHLDPGESLQEAAIRETLEETGWDVDLDCFLGVQQWRSPANGQQIVRFAFGGNIVRHHADLALDVGIERALWLSRDEIAAESSRLRSPMVLTTIDDWIAGRRFPLSAVRRVADDDVLRV